MTTVASQVLQHLEAVDAERRLRSATPTLLAKVTAVKAYQQRRFAQTYSDLLATERYGPAVAFFLEELYGPDDFTVRDQQFSRVVPTISKVFHRDVVQAVADLTELHALSESLDTSMGLALSGSVVDAQTYAAAWRRSGNAADRERQILLTVGLGKSLDQLTRKNFLRIALRMMRRPAVAAGLGELQEVLESGFDAFAAMHGAAEFLSIVESRERRFIHAQDFEVIGLV